MMFWYKKKLPLLQQAEGRTKQKLKQTKNGWKSLERTARVQPTYIHIAGIDVVPFSTQWLQAHTVEINCKEAQQRTEYDQVDKEDQKVVESLDHINPNSHGRVYSR